MWVTAAFVLGGILGGASVAAWGIWSFVQMNAPKPQIGQLSREQAETLLEPYRALIGRALTWGDGTHTHEDLVTGLASGSLQAWPLPHSIVLTSVFRYPTVAIAHVFLVAGEMREIELIAPIVFQWARNQGCDKLMFTGRPGWKRSFLTTTAGFQLDERVTLVKVLGDT